MLDRGFVENKRNNISLFCALEEVQVQLKLLPKYTSPRKKMIKAILASEDVQFYWLFVTADFEVDEDEMKSTLLSMIVELYLMI